MHSHRIVVIGIPLFNESAYIKETLESVISQTYRDFLVLIADNASTDGSSEICKEAAQLDNRISYVNHGKNLGASENFRYIYEATSSKYLMWLGAHDKISPSYLETQLRLLEADSSIALAYSRVNRIDELGNPQRESNGGSFLYRGKPIKRYLQAVRGPWHECTAINGVYRRTALAGIRFFSFASPDHLILTRVQYNGSFARTEKSLYSRRSFSRERQTYMERIKGSTYTKSPLPIAGHFRYYPLCCAQIRDFFSLPEPWHNKARYLPELLINLQLAYGIINPLIPKPIRHLLRHLHKSQSGTI